MLREGMIKRASAFYRDGAKIKARVSDNVVEFANNVWTTALNYAGAGSVNLFKLNEYDEIEVGATMNIGAITAEEDSGAVVAMDMPVSATPAAGTEESLSYRIDGETLLKLYAEADSSGGIQKPGIVVEYQINLKEITTPTAVADYGAIYTKADNKLYFQDGAGVEHEVAFV